METLSYHLLPSVFGTLGVVWQETEKGPKVRRILLPGERTAAEDLIQMTFADAKPQSCPAITALGERIQGFLRGEAVDFELDLIALERCSEFQRKVLLSEHEIPRGWVSTYGRIAQHLGTPGAARAVGSALARNPFPIIIPCHRAIRSDGTLGGFQGGLKMKRALLKLEGVGFSRSGRIVMTKVCY
jgi:methylated-DNA-[protein]-cysteine S-methyltransferase